VRPIDVVIFMLRIHTLRSETTHQEIPAPESGDSEFAVVCPKCGYNLHALTSDRCPECGVAVDLEALSRQHLPWVYRKEKGRGHAFWHTVWMMTFRRKRLRNESAHPVSYPASQSFRWTLIGHLYAILLVATVFTIAIGDRSRLDPLEFEKGAGWFGLIGSTALVHLWIVGYLAAITGLPSYFFHPSHMSIERQNRAIALSYYTAAPLAWLLPAAALFGTGLFIRSECPGHILEPILLIAAGALAVLALLSWPLGLRFLAHATLTPGKSGKITLLLPLLWLGVTAVIGLVLPLIALFIVVFIASLG
jgi:hypothetical protein